MSVKNAIYQRRAALALALAGSLMLAGCGGGSSDTDADDSQVATDSVSSSLSSGLKAVAALADGSSALDTMFSALGMGGMLDDSDDGSDDTVDLLVADLDEMVGSFFGNPVQSGSTITYSPDAATVCSGNLMGEVVYGPTVEEQAECLQVTAGLSLVQQVISAGSGTLSYLYDSNPMVTVGYSQGGLYAEVDLAELGAALMAISQRVDPPEDQLQLPDTLEGVVRLTLTVTDTTPGAEAGGIVLAIRETINIAGSVDGQNVSVSLAPSSQVFALNADAATNVASLSVDLAAVDALFPVEDAQAISYPAALSLAGLTGTASISGNGATLQISDLGLGSGPFTYRIDGQNVLELDLDDLDLAIDGAGKTMTLGSALNLTLAAANVYGIPGSSLFDFATDPTDPSLQGTLQISAPAGTSLLVIDPDPLVDGDELLQVSGGGPVMAEATGYYADPTSSVTVSLGACLAEEDSGPFPLQSGACP